MAGPNCMLNCNKNKKLPRPHNEKNKEHMYVCMQQRKPEQARGEVYATGRYPRKERQIYSYIMYVYVLMNLPR